MRILVVAEDFPALSETFVLEQVEGLRRLGHEVVVAADRPRDDVTHVDFSLAFPIVHAGDPPGRIARASTLARAVVGAVRSGDRVALTELARAAHDQWRSGGSHCSPDRLLRYRTRLGPLFGSFDAVLAQFGPNGDLMTRLAALSGTPVPVVTLFHGYDVSSYVAGARRGVYRRLFSRGVLFLAVCEAMRRRLVALGCPDERTAVHRMGVDCRRLRPAARSVAMGGRPFAFLAIGRLVEKKGARVAIDALARVRDRLGPGSARLTLIGDGPLRPDLQRRVGDLDLDASVTFAGPRPHAGVLTAIEAADALVQPSITAANGDIEGVPVALMEAMALGLPVIATDHGGIPELVENEVGGLLVAEKDAEGLANAMIRLVSDEDLRRRLAVGGRRAVEIGFDTDHWNRVLADRLAAAARLHRSMKPLR